jgi:hypothetical protein
MKLAELNVATLAGLLICALTVRGEQGSNNVEQRVNNILNQMTLDEKLSYIGGTGFWDIKPIPRLGLTIRCVGSCGRLCRSGSWIVRNWIVRSPWMI